MSYGIRLRNAAGSILMELIGQSARTVYRQSLGTIINGMMVTVPGFDPARGIVFIIASGNAFGEMPLYTISGNVMTFHWNGSSEATYIPRAVMFPWAMGY